MHSYFIFGGRFRAALAFPDLEPAPDPLPDSAADWELRVMPAPAPDVIVLEELGTAAVTDGVNVTLTRHAGGLRLVFEDTGTFDVDAGGRIIVWFEQPGADLDAVRLDVTGRVLPVALHAAGTLTLHGSAVRLGTHAVAFLGPKHHGKSTLAKALAAAGAELLSDDAVPVRLGARVTTLPGIRRVRLWSDAAARLGALQAHAAAPLENGEKHLLQDAPAAHTVRGQLALDALYLLAPARVDGGPAARRVSLPAVQATVGLVAQMKLGSLLGGSESGRVLQFCAGLAARVPVCRLEIVRDFDRLDEVVDAVTGWHADLPVPAGRAQAQ